ncbi:hypothetical protein BC937DRAFT_93864 [Endogone sp. FLAS-F59071]|nr:hypothetical protein BC937DRAFT_93864 [Endogone sp. FLAS-F59071]|eukprot:RUS14418.1 hypothetical protein BC937DRAFT_93864 [Endogone sp. FLAS-F59071]
MATSKIPARGRWATDPPAAMHGRVMQQLHDFEYVNAFLSPLFDEHAEEWFERYLPEGVKMDIAKSAAMAAQAAQAAQAASSNATNMPSASASPMPDQPGFMSDLPPLGATMSYRNELDEYLLRRRIMFPNSYCGDLRVSFEQAGEDNRTQWVARVQIEVDNGEILYKFAQGLSKKVAQNEACYLLLKEVQKYDAQVRMNYGPSPTSSYPPPSPAFPSPSPAHVPPSSDYVSPTPAYASPTTPAYASPTTPAYPTSSLVSSYSTFYDSSAAFNRKRSHSDYSSDLRGSAPTSSASSVTSRSTMSRLNSEFDSISMQQPPYGGSSQYYSSRSSSPPTSISSGPSSSSHMPQYPLHPSSHPQPTPPPPEAAPRPLFPMTTFSDMLPTSNYKGLLLTLCQRNRGIVPIPEYASGKEGPHHAPHFWAQVKVGEFVGMGKGQKKIEAEQSAAKDVLSKMCGETVK